MILTISDKYIIRPLYIFLKSTKSKRTDTKSISYKRIVFSQFHWKSLHYIGYDKWRLKGRLTYLTINSWTKVCKIIPSFFAVGFIWRILHKSYYSQHMCRQTSSKQQKKINTDLNVNTRWFRKALNEKVAVRMHKTP